METVSAINADVLDPTDEERANYQARIDRIQDDRIAIKLGRNPTETELAQVLEFIDSEDSAWHYVAHTLIQSNEFCFID